VLKLNLDFFKNLPLTLQKLFVHGNLNLSTTVDYLPPLLTFLKIWYRDEWVPMPMFDSPSSVSNLPRSLTHLSSNAYNCLTDDMIAHLPRNLKALIVPLCPLLTDNGVADLPKHLHWVDLGGSDKLTSSVVHLLPPGQYPRKLFPHTKGVN
jgi:hypothetical protein